MNCAELNCPVFHEAAQLFGNELVASECTRLLKKYENPLGLRLCEPELQDNFAVALITDSRQRQSLDSIRREPIIAEMELA
jgi:hypothetical protein